MAVGVALVATVAMGCGTTTSEEAAPETASPSGSRSPAPASGSASPPPSSGTPKPSPDREAGTEIVVAPSEFGPMLFDVTGQAIYLFDAESGSRPRCYDACAEAWPPVLTEGAPEATGGARPGLLGTTRRADGSRQVTYAGHPLYFYAHEGKNQVLCHDVEEYGGTWLVVRPDGAAAD